MVLKRAVRNDDPALERAVHRQILRSEACSTRGDPILHRIVNGGGLQFPAPLHVARIIVHHKAELGKCNVARFLHRQPEGNTIVPCQTAVLGVQHRAAAANRRVRLCPAERLPAAGFAEAV